MSNATDAAVRTELDAIETAQYRAATARVCPSRRPTVPMVFSAPVEREPDYVSEHLAWEQERRLPEDVETFDADTQRIPVVTDAEARAALLGGPR